MRIKVLSLFVQKPENPAHGAKVHRSRLASAGFSSSSSISQSSEAHIALASMTKMPAVSTTSCVGRHARVSESAVMNRQDGGLCPRRQAAQRAAEQGPALRSSLDIGGDGAIAFWLHGYTLNAPHA